MALNLALYIGPYRFPMTPSDIGVEMFEQMRQGRHRIGVVIAAAGDVVGRLAVAAGIPLLELPEDLLRPVSEMRRIFAGAQLPEPLRQWLAALRAYDTDLGVVYCGPWIPQVLAGIPRHGFINLHPGPLPEFTGYDPEKFLILGGHSEGWGTIHRVADHFDTGNILATSAPVAVTPRSTTPELAKLISRQCFKALPAVLDQFEQTPPVGRRQEEARRAYVSRTRGYRESVIDWAGDSHDKLLARLRAFNSLSDGMCLKTWAAGKLRVVWNLETHRGAYPGRPGEVVGRYPATAGGEFDDALVLRSAEGVAVVAVGPELSAPDQDFFLPSAQLMQPERLGRQVTAVARIDWKKGMG